MEKSMRFRELVWNRVMGISEEDSLPPLQSSHSFAGSTSSSSFCTDSASIALLLPGEEQAESTAHGSHSDVSVCVVPESGESRPRRDSAISRENKQLASGKLKTDIGGVEEYYVDLTKSQSQLWERLYKKKGHRYFPILTEEQKENGSLVSPSARKSLERYKLDQLNENSRIFGLSPNSDHYIRIGHFVNDENTIDPGNVYVKAEVLVRVQRRYYRISGTSLENEELSHNTIIAATVRRSNNNYAVTIHAKRKPTSTTADESKHWEVIDEKKVVSDEHFKNFDKLYIRMRNEDCGINFNFDKAEDIMVYQLPVDLYRGEAGRKFLPEAMANNLKKFNDIPAGFKLWLNDGHIEVCHSRLHVMLQRFCCCHRRQQEQEDQRKKEDLYVKIDSQKEFINTTFYFLVSACAKLINEFNTIAMMLSLHYNSFPAYAFLFQGLLGQACNVIRSITLAESQLATGVMQEELQLNQGETACSGYYRLKVTFLIYLWAPQSWVQTLMQVHPRALGQGRFAGKFKDVRIFGTTWLREQHYTCENHAFYLPLYPHTLLKEFLGLVLSYAILVRQGTALIAFAFLYKLTFFLYRVLTTYLLIRAKLQFHHMANKAWKDMWPHVEPKPRFDQEQNTWNASQTNLARMLLKNFPSAPGGEIERYRFYHSFGFRTGRSTIRKECARWLIRVMNMIQISLVAYQIFLGEFDDPNKKSIQEVLMEAWNQADVHSQADSRFIELTRSCLVEKMEQIATNKPVLEMDFRSFLREVETRDALFDCLTDAR